MSRKKFIRLKKCGIREDVGNREMFRYNTAIVTDLSKEILQTAIRVFSEEERARGSQ